MAVIRAEQSHDQVFWTDRISRYRQGQHSPQQALPERILVVASEQETVVGFAAADLTRRLNCDGELQWIDVAPHKRGQGIARELIRAIGRWFVQQNARRICVNVDPNNAPARALYTKSGANALGEHWMLWTDAGRMKDAASS